MKKILVVDDSPAWRVFHKNNIEEIFIELGINEYRYDIAESAKEGYDYIMQNHDNPYDLIITDLQMEEDFSPKYAGEWLVEQIKTFNKYFNTKIIICSGCYNIKQIAENYSVDFIPKRAAVSNINDYKNVIMEHLKK